MEEEIKNITQEEVLEVIKNFPIEPRERRVIISVNVDTYEDENDINLSDTSFSEIQYIIAVGDYVKDLDPGQKVILDVRKMMDREGKIEIDPIEVNGRMYATIYDGSIKHKDNR